jgi:hypothetical protein
MKTSKADAIRPGAPRLTAMSVPGDRDDGADTGWHVYDLFTRTSERIGTGEAGLRRASEACARSVSYALTGVMSSPGPRTSSRSSMQTYA